MSNLKFVCVFFFRQEMCLKHILQLKCMFWLFTVFSVYFDDFVMYNLTLVPELTDYNNN